MRLELVLEPDIQPIDFPDYVGKPIISNRRVIARVQEKDIAMAIDLAQSLKEKGIAEEFFLGPTTLEDTYVRIIGRLDILGIPEEE